jgi:hypothetical protein
MLPIIEDARRFVAQFDPDKIDAQSIRRLIVEGLRIGADGSVSKKFRCCSRGRPLGFALFRAFVSRAV